MLELKELSRQIVHMIFGAVLILAAGYIGQQNTVILLALILALGLLLVQLKLERRKVPIIDLFLGELDRKENIPARGGITYVAGLLFAFAAMDFTFALGITAILAFGDGFSTVIGLSGKNKLPFNKKKTVEGVLAFVIAGTASSMPFIGVESALAYSIFLGLVEAVDFGVDDNILIPLAASVIKTALK